MGIKIAGIANDETMGVPTMHQVIGKRALRALLLAGFALAALAPAANAGIISSLLGGAKPGNTPGQGGYVPPMHGTNPHGQGTVATVDLSPDERQPVSGDPAGGRATEGEEVVVNRSRAERDTNGRYTSDAQVAGVLGNSLLGVQAEPGESDHGPLEPVQAGVLDPLCQGLNHLVCAEVLRADASADDHSAQSSTAVADVQVGGDDGAEVKAGESNGSISDDGEGCTTSHGDATTAGATLGSHTLANAASSSTTADSCDGAGPGPPDPGPAQDSTVVDLLGFDLPLPVAGCGNGTPNSEFTLLSELVSTSCHASDTSNTGTQLPAEYGVREALTGFVLEGGGTALIKATLGASEGSTHHP